MKKIEKFTCWICKTEYDDIVTAKTCEAKGLLIPYFGINDEVTYQASMGADQHGPYFEERNGSVIDVLLPMPCNRIHGGFALLHNYHVSYMVRVTRRENQSAEQFFDGNNIDLLQTIRTVEVVDEDALFSANGINAIQRLNSNSHRSHRAIVTDWNQYMTEVLQRNPQLEDRIQRFTVELQRLDCL